MSILQKKKLELNNTQLLAAPRKQWNANAAFPKILIGTTRHAVLYWPYVSTARCSCGTKGQAADGDDVPLCDRAQAYHALRAVQATTTNSPPELVTAIREVVRTTSRSVLNPTVLSDKHHHNLDVIIVQEEHLGWSLIARRARTARGRREEAASSGDLKAPLAGSMPAPLPVHARHSHAACLHLSVPCYRRFSLSPAWSRSITCTRAAHSKLKKNGWTVDRARSRSKDLVNKRSIITERTHSWNSNLETKITRRFSDSPYARQSAGAWLVAVARRLLQYRSELKSGCRESNRFVWQRQSPGKPRRRFLRSMRVVRWCL